MMLPCVVHKTANSLELMPQRCPWLTGEYIPGNSYRFIMFGNDLTIADGLEDKKIHGTAVLKISRLYRESF